MPSITIRSANESDLPALAALTLDCVQGGASIGFMADIQLQQLIDFWTQKYAESVAGARRILIAEMDSQVVGTVQLVLNMPDNQPHRADVAKLQVSQSARNQGIAERLMKAIQQEATACKRTLLVLDTVTGSAADRLYRRLGWQECGQIPDYALLPDGRFCGTTVFYKQLVAESN